MTAAEGDGFRGGEGHRARSAKNIARNSDADTIAVAEGR